MSTAPITVHMDDPLSRVKQLFEQHGFRHLLVVEDQTLRGIISDRDLLRALSPQVGTAAETARDTAALNKRAHQIMTRKPVTLSAEAGLFDAIEIFNQQRISCIPIVDDAMRPVGIVSWRDIFRALAATREKNS